MAQHSCMDGTPTSRLNDWLLRALDSKKVEPGPAEPRTDLPSPAALTFELADPSKKAIDQAIRQHRETMDRHQIAILNYTGFGKNLIKVRFSCTAIDDQRSDAVTPAHRPGRLRPIPSLSFVCNSLTTR